MENNEIKNVEFEKNNKEQLEPLEKSNTTKKKRCFHCRKKSLYVTMCKCGQVFCLNHNQPEIHNCTFNHKLNKVMLEPIICQKIATI